MWQSISRDFSLADHILPTYPEPAWPNMAQSSLNGTTQPVDIEEEGLCFNYQQTMAEKMMAIESTIHNEYLVH